MTFGPRTFTPGELDQRVTIQSPTNMPDGRGGVVSGWEDVATVWAHVRPKSGRERSNADRVEASANYLIVIRWRAIDPSWRIVWNGIPFNIRFPADYGRRALYLELDAERGVAQ